MTCLSFRWLLIQIVTSFSLDNVTVSVVSSLDYGSFNLLSEVLNRSETVLVEATLKHLQLELQPQKKSPDIVLSKK